ncbi:uncharacterized protein BDCG_06712 [Blastomyces dermatitidis ER-3]|uniref:Uncharacterized protein n=1 Tax=Ajellomyces dermatitidis (strain ER-3 / ATCC MYA-2586) TaxID=559297 RepID=A0ABP2F3V1_AJEDR|nr:uncharacterized protein BDCG_06712 [Blastomyces dermatitidis ER-3]EEQ91592.2 hypothetical protein BDCG_06712 [Blastomyces dermatitidis ER-3]
MSSLFKYSAVLRTIKAHEHCHRLKKEKKKIFKYRETDHKTYYNYRNNMNSITYKRLKKKIQELAEKKKIETLFRSQMHFMIQNIEKTALLSEHVNLLTARVESETADQKMQDFEMQVDLAKKKQ